jgi:hypothetical protein
MGIGTLGLALSYMADLEKQVMSFYSEVAQTEKYAPAASIFAALAEDGRKPKAMLMRLRQEADASDSDTSPARLPISDVNLGDYSPGFTVTPGASLSEVLRLALEAEDNIGKFYQGLIGNRQLIPNYFISTFEKLAQESGKRKEKLESFSNSTS